MRDKIIRIMWSKPLPINNAIVSDISITTGLYYITRVFGDNETSLYIGKATGGNTIRNRLKSHLDDWLYSYRGTKYVRIGTIIYPRTVTDSIIDHAENAILYHNNFLEDNTAKVKSYSYEELYRIENEGSIFEIPPVIRMQEH